MPIKNKDCEIKAIPELLKLLDIHGSTVTTDAIGTQTRIMDQIISQEGHFVLMVKKNQPQLYEEIVKYLEEMSEDRYAVLRGSAALVSDRRSYFPLVRSSCVMNTMK